jgi:DNA-binding MarR family transcriptional regulator
MPPLVPELTAHLGFWLRHVSNHVSYAFARKLAAKDVTVAEWALMRMLYAQEPTSPSEIADRLGLTRGAVTKLADRLIAKALIIREPKPDDGRAQTLCLTEKGTGFVPDLAALADQNEAECFAHLSDSERRSMKRILKKTVKQLGLTAVPID